MLSPSFTNGDFKLQYTSYCLDFHVYSESNDFIYLLSTGSSKAIYRSQSPYTQLREVSLSTPFNMAEFLGIVNDVTKSSEVLLMKTSLNEVRMYNIEDPKTSMEMSLVRLFDKAVTTIWACKYFCGQIHYQIPRH